MHVRGDVRAHADAHRTTARNGPRTPAIAAHVPRDRPETARTDPRWPGSGPVPSPRQNDREFDGFECDRPRGRRSIRIASPQHTLGDRPPRRPWRGGLRRSQPLRSPPRDTPPGAGEGESQSLPKMIAVPTLPLRMLVAEAELVLGGPGVLHLGRVPGAMADCSDFRACHGRHVWGSRDPLDESTPLYESEVKPPGGTPKAIVVLGVSPDIGDNQQPGASPWPRRAVSGCSIRTRRWSSGTVPGACGQFRFLFLSPSDPYSIPCTDRSRRSDPGAYWDRIIRYQPF
jgi:hypothetical protein